MLGHPVENTRVQSDPSLCISGREQLNNAGSGRTDGRTERPSQTRRATASSWGPCPVAAPRRRRRRLPPPPPLPRPPGGNSIGLSDLNNSPNISPKTVPKCHYTCINFQFLDISGHFQGRFYFCSFAPKSIQQRMAQKAAPKSIELPPRSTENLQLIRHLLLLLHVETIRNRRDAASRPVSPRDSLVLY